jgi:hypothetical protein
MAAEILTATRLGLCSEGLRRSIARGNSPNADMATSKALYQKAW